MYAQLIKKIFINLFGKENTIAVTEYTETKKNQERETVQVIIVPGEEYFAKVIGRGGETINLIETLVRIKSYLNNNQVFIKVEKDLLTNR